MQNKTTTRPARRAELWANARAAMVGASPQEFESAFETIRAAIANRLNMEYPHLKETS
ncbi:hypothetical protein SAMN05444287_0903 [Octadecabacter temperatus]|uniref:Uncharacterized protein n=1 Tax=Octadecabacter temperatus TaxID=1458307 RepID=A0A0K0Y4C5_9RHOB|nr:hypothetical protein [Octadecabacter temperatus]AKS45804.1 hypothetical protein OSB_12490 [Octadecabacter temperatus]SIO00903.1 hypothetical protein SAMN05444287_0903 [Octadecabacter temperatus]